MIGRAVLANLTTTVAGDAGDPLLTAAILHWNAHHVPWTDAWWQFPIFHPTRDTLAFSEHLLGLTPISAPLDWLSGSPLLTYNLIALLTFVLSGASMYLLVYRLTRQRAGAFIAGLAFGFAPYRIAHLPHIQVLAAFWAPLALLGLHAFIESGRRRWLALYGVAWALQAAANGYALVTFSVLVGLWVLWFVAARRRWRDLAWIAAASVAAAIPLAPILLTYLGVHDYHGFARTIDEIRQFSADAAAVLCAPRALTLWGNLRVACAPEGELFPGVGAGGVVVAALLGVLGVLRPAPALPSPRPLTIVRRLLLAVAAVYAVVAISVGLAAGPWRLDVSGFGLSASSVGKPLLADADGADRGARPLARRARVGATLVDRGVLPAGGAGHVAPGARPDDLGDREPTNRHPRAVRRPDAAAGRGRAARAGAVLADDGDLPRRGRRPRRGGAAGRARPAALPPWPCSSSAPALAADGWVDRIHAAPVPPPAPDPGRLAGQPGARAAARRLARHRRRSGARSPAAGVSSTATAASSRATTRR